MDAAAISADPESLGLPVKDVSEQVIAAAFPWHLVTHNCSVLKA